MARPKKQSAGVGDTIEKILIATKIDKVAKFILGEDCKCNERKEKLNKIFPYKRPLCLTESEYTWLSGWLLLKQNNVNPVDQSQILSIYNRIFHQRNEPTNCGSCLLDMVEDLRKVAKLYEEEQIA